MSALIKVNHESPEDKKRDYALWWGEMFPYVVVAVEDSFLRGKDQGAMRTPTRAEVKERSNICKDLVEFLRQEKGWSKMRIRDHLSMLLRAKLAGIEVDYDSLDARVSW